MNPKLSILTPTIPGRELQLRTLQDWVQMQISEIDRIGSVEHLSLCDNRTRSIGGKRQALLDIASGEYIAFVDDDDDITDNYVAELLNAIESGADVITFEQEATYNGLKSKVIFRLGQGDGPFIPGGETLRDAWHVNAWKRSVVIGCAFPETNYGEDRGWSLQARRLVKTRYHIPKVLHFYRHSAETTAAPEN